MAEIDLTTDRDLASQSENYELWLPKNQGPEDSWGVLLNENFDKIDDEFVELATTIDNILASERDIEARLGTERSRINANIIRLDANDIKVDSNTSRISAIESEIDDASGIFDTLGERIDIVIDASGQPRTDNILSTILRLKWNKHTTSIGSGIFSMSLGALFTGGVVDCDGTYKGIIAKSAGGYNKGHVFSSTGKPIYSEDGQRIICSFSRVSNDLFVYFYKVDGSAYTFNQPGADATYSDIIIFYPEIVDADNLNDPDDKRLYPEFSNPASVTEYGVVKMGHTHAMDADTVDTFHASATPTANTLLPLNASGEFASEQIGINGESGPTTLANVYPFLLQTDYPQTHKTISDYIGTIGSEIFAKVKTGNEGAQFTVYTISQLENAVAYAVDGVDTNATNLANEITRAISGENVVASDLIDEINRATAAESSITSDLEAEVIRASDAETALQLIVEDNQMFVTGEFPFHESNPDAHHPANLAGLDVSPQSLQTPSAVITTLEVTTMLVDDLQHVAKEVVQVDRFSDVAYPSGEISGENPTLYGSVDVPFWSEYTGGFVFHKGKTGPVSGEIGLISGEYALLRYNKLLETLEFAPKWNPILVDKQAHTDGNEFIRMGQTAGTKVLVPGSSIQDAINELAAEEGGKIIIREGVYPGNVSVSGEIVLEGMGHATRLGNITVVSGEYAEIRHLACNDLTLNSGAMYGKILHNYVSGEFTNNSGNSTNTIFDNTDLGA